ncbi:MAG: riboflavin synthase subunit beta [Flavobacteriaceae bacterium]
MGIFKLRKNKKFSYQPRYYKSNEDGSNPFEIKHKFDEYRKTVGSHGLKGKFNNAIDELKNEPDREVNRRVLFIAAILILIFLFFIGFDLTIFFS